MSRNVINANQKREQEWESECVERMKISGSCPPVLVNERMERQKKTIQVVKLQKERKKDWSIERVSQIKRNRLINSICTQHFFNYFIVVTRSMHTLNIYPHLILSSISLRRRNFPLLFSLCLVVRVNCQVTVGFSVFSNSTSCTKMDIFSLSELVLMRQYDASHSQILAHIHSDSERNHKALFHHCNRFRMSNTNNDREREKNSRISMTSFILASITRKWWRRTRRGHTEPKNRTHITSHHNTTLVFQFFVHSLA